jgi:hypothetical protein
VTAGPDRTRSTPGGEMAGAVLAHYGGIPEMAIFLVPVSMGVGLWWIFRGGDPSSDEPPEESR